MKSKNIIFFSVLFVFLLPFLTFFLFQNFGAIDSFIVRSGSMEPAIETGSITFTKPKNPDTIEEGDIITFRKDKNTQRFTTHRVIDIQQSDSGDLSFKTKGDNNESPDAGRVEEDDIVGENILSVPFIGYLINWSSSLIGLTVLIFIPAIIIISMEINKIARNADLFENDFEKFLGPIFASAIISLAFLSTTLFTSGFTVSYFDIGLLTSLIFIISIFIIQLA